MNTNDSFVKVYEFLLENAPETAHDVYEGLEMFKAGLEYGYEAICKLIRENCTDFSLFVGVPILALVSPES